MKYAVITMPLTLMHKIQMFKGIDGISSLISMSYEHQEGMDYFEYNEENKITRLVGFPGSLA